ncbi:MAG: tRNA (cytidine(34)-2'-O)-methyltransferase [Candidatus Cloacimonetes bacterium]|nr:tRNA (cytidine(34)-2'-O)-methyltransferase [Candidatus Cloacimonadota bacterium]
MAEDNEGLTFRVVLYQPEIPANTGNIGRLCLGMDAQLHIIKPMRFLINDKYLRRAGLDYWDQVNPVIHSDFESFLEKYSDQNIYFCSTKGSGIYSDRAFALGDIFVFGPETKGLPENILDRFQKQTLRIPMSDKIRSFNLANSVSIILAEAWRQTGFKV